MMIIDLSVAIYLHSSLDLNWKYGTLFNVLGCAVALYFYYPMFKHKADLFFASLIGSLIYGGYLLGKVFSMHNHKQSVISGLTKDDYLIGTVAMYIDPHFIYMVFV